MTTQVFRAPPSLTWSFKEERARDEITNHVLIKWRADELFGAAGAHPAQIPEIPSSGALRAQKTPRLQSAV